MPRKPRQIIAAALPGCALPELEELLSRYGGENETRGNVVMVRLGNQGLQAVDQLVETGLFRSRSESAAFLIAAGIEAQKDILNETAKHTAELNAVRTRLRSAVAEKLKRSSMEKTKRQSREAVSRD